MGVWIVALWLLGGPLYAGSAVGERARRYLAELVRIDTTNPPGNETRAARWLAGVAAAEGIPCELLGPDPDRLNFIARLAGTGRRRPLLLMAHTDVVPAEAELWTAPPFAGVERDGYIWGRGTLDDKNLLAAELAVMVEVKRRGVKLDRDLILLAEADEESGSSGIRWLLENARHKIDAEFALNEGGYIMRLESGRSVYHVQTSEKIPTRVILRARGDAAHGSVPSPQNAVVTLARAIARLADTEQPVHLNETTRRYLGEMAKLDEYRWLAPLLPRLSRPQSAIMAAQAIGAKNPEMEAQLRTSISPTVLKAGTTINVIPNTAEAHLDVRRLPNESREEVVARLRRAIHDSTVEILPAPGPEIPRADPSPHESRAYRRMEQVFLEASPGALVVPFMQPGATDGAFLRRRGVPVYGVPLFLREDPHSRAHGNDERIAVSSLEAGAALLYRIVLAADR